MKSKSVNLVKFLRPHVSGYSLSFQMNNDTGDDVVAGGEITRIVDLTSFAESKNPTNVVYLTLDDGVGETIALVPRPFWKEQEFVRGDIIVAKGILCQLEKNSIFISEADTEIKVEREDEPMRLLVMSLYKLKNIQDL